MNWERFNQFKKEIKNKKILILGLGLQGGGVGAVRFFHELRARLRVTDLKTGEQLRSSLEKIKNIPVEEYTFGKHEISDVDWADLIVLNPDLPHNAAILKYAFSQNKNIQMDEALFVSLCPASDVIGITGTRGKTTTTTLTFELLKTQYPVILGGNISGSETLMSLFKIQNENTKVILELSSFQLYGFHLNRVSPHVAVMTNIYEDHLNKYETIKDYIWDKKAIYLYQNANDFLIINERLCSNDPHDQYGIPNGKRGKLLTFSKEETREYDLKLFGDHNAENFAAALRVSRLFSLDEKNIRGVLGSFTGVPFRQEVVEKKNGVIFVNDTTATTPAAAAIAVEAYKNTSFILICGGNSKNCSTDFFAEMAARYAKYIVLLKGNASEDFRKKLIEHAPQKEKIGRIFDNFQEAVSDALSHATMGDYIILSPGFTSFGMFENEFDRGRQFNQIVAGMK